MVPMLFSLGLGTSRKTASFGKCGDRLPTTETGSRATGTGSSATDDVSSVILGKLFFNIHSFTIGMISRDLFQRSSSCSLQVYV